jgi:hypothetical protein
MGSEEFDWGVEFFNWMTFPEADEFLRGLIDDFTVNQNRAGELAGSIEWGTSTRFMDWVDHMVLPEDSVDEDHLVYMGFTEDEKAETQYGARCFRHRGSVLFPILLRSGRMTELAIGVDDLDLFRKRHKRHAEILGDPFSPYRWMDITREHDHLLTAIERRGYDGFFAERPREFSSDEEGLRAVKEMVLTQLEDLNPDRAADAWFRAERDFWCLTNPTAQVQKARQDKVGMGWANRDHQAYRCSRELFAINVEIMELLGLRKREAYYAGHQAGWGAQVMEQTVGRFVAFCDVDMSGEEQEQDFATSSFEPLDELGTIGLWVGLHGESMLQAGIHHLSCAFDFERIRQDLFSRGYSSMQPFSMLPFLKQCFTVSDGWAVDESRTKALLDAKLITQDQYEEFGQQGAIGSHIELIDRGEGFKGFNQDSVSSIIEATDPRTQG